MKIIVAPDSFKGSLKSIEVIDCVKRSALKRFPGAEIVEVPIADGGDGTVEAMVHATRGRIIRAKAGDPLGREIECIYGEAAGAAVIGMSEISGLALLKEDERSAVLTSSHGTGDLIRQALDEGFRDILVGIGGSATNDGGTGALQALGVRFLRADGSEIDRMCGKELIDVARMDDTGLDARLKEARITIMCDVTNPMTGPDGATYVYGPQKGADSGYSWTRWKRRHGPFCGACWMITRGRKISEAPGSGRGGRPGRGAGTAFAGAKASKAASTPCWNAWAFMRMLEGADLVVTGEGRVDDQSASGKVVHGVTRAAQMKRAHPSL